MKRWLIIGVAVAAVMLAVSVYALQGKIESSDSVSGVIPVSDTAGCSGCTSLSGCVSASRGCGSSASSPEQVQSRLEQVEAHLVRYYTERLHLTDVTVEVKSFGCHEEATVKQAGRVVEKLAISGKTISRIEG